MDTIANEDSVGRRRRRNHSTEFKAQVVAACRQPGVSMAAVALANGINANLARRWVADAEQAPSGGSRPLTGTRVVATPPSFVPLGLPSAEQSPATIRIELRRGATTINVSWPSIAAAQCATWLREFLR